MQELLSWASFGLAAALGGVYTVLLFVGHASSRRALFGGGLALAAVGAAGVALMASVLGWRELATWLIAAGWFGATIPTLALPRILGLRLAVGDALPSLRARLVTGEAIDEVHLLSRAPFLLIVFRGHW